MVKKGKLIVIDGTDGSGKATQVHMLLKRLQKEKYKVHIEDFPQYGHKSAGPVEDYLTGMFGTAEELGAYIPSIFYAIDRFAAASRIRMHLAQGDIVISNRYVTASMAHQGGKIANKKHRQDFFKWLYSLEYDFFNVPKPDLQIVFRVPATLAQKLAKQRGPRFYIGKQKVDIHEKDIKHLKATEITFDEIIKKFGLTAIEASENGKMLDPQVINDKLYLIIKKHI